MTDTKSVTFGVYDDVDGPFAVLNEEHPDIPIGTLEAVQDAVDDRDVDGTNELAGTVTYVPGKHDGDVVSIDFE